MHLSRTTNLVVAGIASCALTFGVAGTTAAAVQQPAAAHVAAPVPAPDPSALIGVLSQFGAVGPVADALKAALATPPDLAKVTQLVATAKAALDGLTSALPPVPKSAQRVDPPAPGALLAQAIAQVKAALDALVQAVTSLDPAKILAAVTAAVQAAVNLVAGILLGSGLPVPNLPGLPGLPSVPLPPLPVPLPPLSGSGH